MVTKPVSRLIPQPIRLREFLRQGGTIVGGFPLWLTGATQTYGDIDLYPLTWDRLQRFADTLLQQGTYLGETRSSFIFEMNGISFSLVFPFLPDKNFDGDPNDPEYILHNTDLSITAVALKLDAKQEFYLDVVYPEHIRSRVGHILYDHEWTSYRVKSYEDRGFTFTYPDGRRYQHPK